LAESPRQDVLPGWPHPQGTELYAEFSRVGPVRAQSQGVMQVDPVETVERRQVKGESMGIAQPGKRDVRQFAVIQADADRLAGMGGFEDGLETQALVRLGVKGEGGLRCDAPAHDRQVVFGKGSLGIPQSGGIGD